MGGDDGGGLDAKAVHFNGAGQPVDPLLALLLGFRVEIKVAFACFNADKKKGRGVGGWGESSKGPDTTTLVRNHQQHDHRPRQTHLTQKPAALNATLTGDDQESVFVGVVEKLNAGDAATQVDHALPCSPW